MKFHWRYLSVIISLFVIFILLDSGVMCYLSDRETISDNRVTAYTPKMWRQTTLQDFQNGTVMQTNATLFTGSVVLDRASSVAPTVYAFAGGNTPIFYYYTVTANTWTRGPDAPGSLTSGGKIASDGQQYIYALQGGGSRAFWRFDVVTNMWTSLANAPGPVNAGSDLYYAGGKMYALQGGGSSTVWTYNILTGLWSTVPITGTSYPMNSGACSAVAGAYLYAFRPNTPYFMRVSKNGGTWSSSATDVTQPSNPAGPGSDMFATTGNSIIVLFGNGTNLFKLYTVSSRTWTSYPNTLTQVSIGGGLAYQPANTILTIPSYFALAGGGTQAFWRFTTNNNTWYNRAQIPVSVGAGGGLTYIFSSTSQYHTSGYFTSKVNDTGMQGQLMNSIFWDANIPNIINQDLYLQIRVSNTLLGGVPDAPWVNVTGQALVAGTSTYYGSLSGFTGRYVQFRALMSTLDVTTTPTLYEVRLYYRGV